MFVSAGAHTLHPAEEPRDNPQTRQPQVPRSSRNEVALRPGFGTDLSCAALAQDTRISEADRNQCVQLLKRISEVLVYHFKVFELSVMIFERACPLLATNSSERDRQHLGVICAILAIKFEGVYNAEHLTIIKAATAFKEPLDPNELIRLEPRVLRLLNWRLRLPSPSEMAIELLSAAYRVCTGEEYCLDSDCIEYLDLFIGACLEFAPVARSCSPFNIAVASVSAGLETARSLELSTASILEASKCEAFDMVDVSHTRPRLRLRGSSSSNWLSKIYKPTKTMSGSSFSS